MINNDGEQIFVVVAVSVVREITTLLHFLRMCCPCKRVHWRIDFQFPHVGAKSKRKSPCVSEEQKQNF